MSDLETPGNRERPLCSVRNCPSPAIAEESGELPHWYVTVYYCREHSRELGEGTPLGPQGVDPARVQVEPKEPVELRLGVDRFPGPD